MADILNPHADAEKIHGLDREQFAALAALVDGALRERKGQRRVSEASIRALHPALADDARWNRVKFELRLRTR